MRSVECAHEEEVLALVLESRWPACADPDLRAHAGACELCSDIVAVGAALGDARESTRAGAVVPPAAHVWWRAQMRAQREAAQAAGRPITAVQVFAFACAVGLAGAFFGATSSWFQAAVRILRSTIADLPWTRLFASATTVVTEHAAIALVIAALLVLIPAGFLLAVARE